MTSNMFKCNSCWSELEGKSVVTKCQHLFCLKCAQQIVESDANCPVCDNIITKSTIKVIQSLQDASECQLLLCGQAPETAFRSALASIQFYIAQQQLQAELREAQLTKKVAKVQDACRKKLEEVHNGYVQAKRKYEEAMKSNQQLQQDNQELQAKYAQKAMQARKLQEMLKKCQQESEMVRRQQTPKEVALPGGNRSMSPMAEQAQLVTTVQRTQVFANLQSPQNNGYGNAMQQALLPTSGRVQGITGGYRVQQGGPNVSTGSGGGGFLGGSLGPNSPGDILTTGGQAIRRVGSSGGGGAGAGGGGAMQLGGTMGNGSQNPNNSALRKMLGMPPAQTGAATVRGNGSMRNDLFSM